MFINTITVKDKKGREIFLRSAEEKDAENLINYLKITAAETLFLIREPDEVTLSIEQEQAYIRAKKDSAKELLLIAETDGRHIGNCSLMRVGANKRYRHRCEVAIALYKEYCGFGIGRAMLETVLEAAQQAGYEQAELEVIACNAPAIAFYEKLGFKIYGTFPDYMKYADGSCADACWMMKKLHRRIDITKIGGHYEIRALDVPDVNEILELCRQNTLFYQFCEARPTREQILEDMQATPPGMERSAKYFFGFFENHELVAVMDLIDGYPNPETAYIGFFMMNRKYQGKQIGTEIIAHVTAYLKTIGKTTVRLAIDKGNPQSTHFWKKNGFEVVSEADRNGWTKLVAEKHV